MRLRLMLVLGAFLPGSLPGQAPSSVFRESFDTIMPPALPYGWVSSQARSAGVNDFTTTTSSPRSTPNAVLSTNATVPQELHTPVVGFGAVVPDSISFYVRRSSSHQARVVLEASIDGGATFPHLIGDTLRGLPTTAYTQIRWPIPSSLAGMAARFRWRVIADPSGSTGTMRIDDVRIAGRALHDLVLRSVRINPEQPGPGDSLRVSLVVANAGGLPAGAFAANLFVDEDADSTGEPSELVGSATALPGLSPGDSTRLEISPGVLASGRRLLIIDLAYDADQDTSSNRIVLPLSIGYPRGSVVVNEIMYAPEENEPEWVELLNMRDEAVDLYDWLVSDNTTAGRRTISTSSRGIPPHGTVVLTRDSVSLHARYPLMPPVIITVAAFPALNNTGDAVVLYDDRVAVVDSVSYDPFWGGNAGRSLERIDPAGPGNDPMNWCSSVDSLGATPGSANSAVILDHDLRLLRFSDQTTLPDGPANVIVVVQNAGRLTSALYGVRLFDDVDRDSLADPEEEVAEAGDFPPLARGDSTSLMVAWSTPSSGVHRMVAQLSYPPDMRPSNNIAHATLSVAYAPATVVINEILAEPVAGRPEYVEVTNRSGTVVDLSGWHLRGTSTTARFPVGSGGRKLQPAEYLVIAEDSSLYDAFPYLRAAPPGLVEILNSSLGLNNDRDAVVLADLTATAIDSVSYSSSWHNPGVDDPRGRSLERIRPNQGSNDPRNWSTSVHPAGGTPGVVNSIFTQVLPVTSSLSVSPNPFSPDGDGWEDFAVVQFRLPLQVSVVRLRIYDVRGRLIRTLANNEPAGPSGEVTWDGTDDARRKARIGVYILFLESIDDRGGVVQTVKGTVVLAGRL